MDAYRLCRKPDRLSCYHIRDGFPMHPCSSRPRHLPGGSRNHPDGRATSTAGMGAGRCVFLVTPAATEPSASTTATATATAFAGLGLVHGQ